MKNKGTKQMVEICFKLSPAFRQKYRRIDGEGNGARGDCYWINEAANTSLQAPPAVLQCCAAASGPTEEYSRGAFRRTTAAAAVVEGWKTNGG